MLSRAPATEAAERAVARLTLGVSMRFTLVSGSLNARWHPDSACALACGEQSSDGCSSRPSVSLFEGDYLVGEHVEIYVGRSRHWVLAWLWFLT